MNTWNLITAGALLALAGCAGGTPDCASSEVEAFFQEQVVNPEVDGALERANAYVEQTANNRFEAPVAQSQLRAVEERGPHLRKGFTLKDTHATQVDKDLDIYLCEGTASLDNGVGGSATVDIEYKIYSVEGGDNDFGVEYDDVFKQLVRKALYQ